MNQSLCFLCIAPIKENDTKTPLGPLVQTSILRGASPRKGAKERTDAVRLGALISAREDAIKAAGPIISAVISLVG
jgi:hypothetical protein